MASVANHRPTWLSQDAEVGVKWTWNRGCRANQALIDGAINGSASAVGGLAGVVRQRQTGRLYTYALVMLLGIFGLLTWQLWPTLSGLVGRLVEA